MDNVQLTKLHSLFIERHPDRMGFTGTDAELIAWGERILHTHPTPEPDATKVVSVPVPWRDRVDHYDIKYMTNKAKAAIEAEIAEWRALAAQVVSVLPANWEVREAVNRKRGGSNLISDAAVGEVMNALRALAADRGRT